MDIDRRRLLVGMAAAATTGVIGSMASASEILDLPAIPLGDSFHPLTRSLLERARMIGRNHRAPDRARIEWTIQQFAERSGYVQPPVIKWMDNPSDAFDHLSRLGLDALLDMGTARFWQLAEPPTPNDADAFDRAFKVRMKASELLDVNENDRILMAPKLLAKSRTMSANRSDQEVFRVRAVSAQVGWLETSMADAAAAAVSNVELLLSSGASEGSVAIDDQLKIFEVCEGGLLATWERADALICISRFQKRFAGQLD